SGNTTAVDFNALGVTLTINNDFSSVSDFAITASSAGASTFQVGAENASNNRISVSLGNATASNLGVSDGTIDLSTAAGAQGALTSIDAAISTLAGVQGDIGAYQNRLSFAAANLSVTIENVQAAESVIRDVDMASEMITFTKNQILLQAGTAMLAQANMAPQQVLALFG
ncbi:MAG: flagellin, partial [Deltaproteobacteria bacterium]|nr:flagellin [Deltaproteobacteria bacterium]